MNFEEKKESFGQRLLRLMKEKEEPVSQETLAGLLGVHRNAVNFWVKDKRQPNLENIRLIAHYLDVTYPELFTGESAMDYAVRKETTKLILKDKQATYGKDRKKLLQSIAAKLAKLDKDSLKIVDGLLTKMGDKEE